MTNLKLGFLASGRGSNVQAIVRACRTGILKADPVVIISNNASAGVLDLARREKIEAFHLSRNTHPAPGQLDKTITEILRKHEVDLVLLAGYMKKIGPLMLSAYRNRILNIHPSLLPGFGGPGMFGLNVHQAVLEAHEKESGATVHLVDAEYDQGIILAQRSVKVVENDTPESLAARVLAVEHELYVEVLQNIINGKLQLPASSGK